MGLPWIPSRFRIVTICEYKTAFQKKKYCIFAKSNLVNTKLVC
jgi:hypothetical protein